MRRGTSGISCLIAVDKPVGLTSHDVVDRVRRSLSERRVGHAGTLDPAASGVLIVGVGQATRLLGLLTLEDKRYEARIAFGTQTTTDDAEGEVVRSAPVPERLGEEAVAAAVVASLVGPCDQVPPAFSAISVDGRRAYERARSGDEVELPVRQVTIHEARLVGIASTDPLCWDCDLLVSKGTYVRSIARDLGQSLGTVAHLAGLVRTASGPVSRGDCLELSRLEQEGPAALGAATLDPTQVLGLVTHRLDAVELGHVRAGRRFRVDWVTDTAARRRRPQKGELISLVSGGRLMGVWKVQGGVAASVRTFPDGVTGVRE